MRWERHLEHWIVGLRVGWLDDVSIALSWIGTWGAVWLAIALAPAVAWRQDIGHPLGPGCGIVVAALAQVGNRTLP